MRIRTIKPEFWRSDDITALCRDDRLLFIGLWSYVDDSGVGIDDVRLIQAELFAFEDDTAEYRQLIREGLARLSRQSLIVRYRSDGKRYLAIKSWTKHQKIDKPGKTRFPPPDAVTSENVGDDPDHALGSRESRDTPAPGTGEQGNRGTGESAPTERAPAAPTGATTSRDVVAAWVDAMKDRGVSPSKSQIGQVAKSAKELLDLGNDPQRVISAASAAGAEGWCTIDRTLSRMAGRAPLRSVPAPGYICDSRGRRTEVG